MTYDEVEYKVRPVTRYIVTRYERKNQVSGAQTSSSENCGEFDNVRKANCVASALAKDHQSFDSSTEVFYQLYSHEYDELEFPNNGLIKVK